MTHHLVKFLISNHRVCGGCTCAIFLNYMISYALGITGLQKVYIWRLCKIPWVLFLCLIPKLAALDFGITEVKFKIVCCQRHFSNIFPPPFHSAGCLYLTCFHGENAAVTVSMWSHKRLETTGQSVKYWFTFTRWNASQPGNCSVTCSSTQHCLLSFSWLPPTPPFSSQPASISQSDSGWVDG